MRARSMNRKTCTKRIVPWSTTVRRWWRSAGAMEHRSFHRRQKSWNWFFWIRPVPQRGSFVGILRQREGNRSGVSRGSDSARHDFRDLAASYDAWYQTPLGAFAHAVERDAVLGLAEAKPGERALDIGCGTGI